MRFLIAFLLAASTTGAVADGKEEVRGYSALDSLRRAQVGTFSPALRTPEREEGRKDRTPAEIRWPVRCKFDESRPGTITCEEQK